MHAQRSRGRWRERQKGRGREKGRERIRLPTELWSAEANAGLDTRMLRSQPEPKSDA